MATKTKTAASTKRKKTQKKESFLTFKPTIQTAYWLILSLLVLGLGVWVLQLTIQTQNIYDKIQYINTTSEVTK